MHFSLATIAAVAACFATANAAPASLRPNGFATGFPFPFPTGKFPHPTGKLPRPTGKFPHHSHSKGAHGTGRPSKAVPTAAAVSTGQEEAAPAFPTFALPSLSKSGAAGSALIPQASEAPTLTKRQAPGAEGPAGGSHGDHGAPSGAAEVSGVPSKARPTDVAGFLSAAAAAFPGFAKPSGGAGGFPKPSGGVGGFPKPSGGAGGFPKPSGGAGGFPKPSGGFGGFPKPSGGLGGFPKPSGGVPAVGGSLPSGLPTPSGGEEAPESSGGEEEEEEEEEEAATPTSAGEEAPSATTA